MATGDTLYVFTGIAGEPPSSSYATPDLQNSTAIWNFDASSDESVQFTGIMPSHYAASTGIKARIAWSTTAVVNNCVWNVAFKSLTDDTDTLAKAYATAQAVTDAAPSATDEILYAEINFTHAQADSIAAGELFRVQVTRDADNVSDTISVDCYLVALELQDRGDV